MSSFSIDSSVLNSTLNSDYIATSWGRHCLTINIQELTASSATEALTTIEAPSSVDPLSPFEFPLLFLLFERVQILVGLSYVRQGDVTQSYVGQKRRTRI